MSWKGFQKSVVRAPQTVRQKFNIGEVSKDPIYLDADRRFSELERETKKLHEESKKYQESINKMLSHQIEFSKALAELYKPISGRPSDPNSYKDEGNPEGIRACEQYEEIVADLQQALKPELDLIDTRIIGPANELLEVMKQVRKVAVKRDHKQLDYDRHRTALKKLQEKKDKTVKDEKAIFKAESDVETATQDFNYFNELLKTELPKFFELEREFIKPLFTSLYYMQLNIFYTMYQRMQNLNIGYFDMEADVESGFEKRWNEMRDQAEQLSLVHFKKTGGFKKGQSKYAKSEVGESSTSLTAGPRRPRASTLDSHETPPPPYSPGGSNANAPGATPQAPHSLASFIPPARPSSANASRTTPGPSHPPTSSSSNVAAAAKAKGHAPPPPKPKPARLAGQTTGTVAAGPASAPLPEKDKQPVETVTALFDYEAQAHGDLSFSVGDVIEIVRRSANENEWWRGRIDGREGQFPGNYVRLNK